MIRVPMTASSLATSRFAVSRLSEAADGLRALTDPASFGHVRSWVRWARPRIRRLDLSLIERDDPCDRRGQAVGLFPLVGGPQHGQIIAVDTI